MSRTHLSALAFAMACGSALAAGAPVTEEPLPLHRPLAATFVPPLSGVDAGSGAEGRVVVLGEFGVTGFTVVDGRLPEGVSIAADGSLSGTFAERGSYAATVRVETGDGRTTDVPVAVEVAPGGHGPEAIDQ